MKTIDINYVIPYIQYGLMVKSKKTGDIFEVEGYLKETLFLKGHGQCDLDDVHLLLNPINEIVLFNGDAKEPYQVLGNQYKSDLNWGVCFLGETLFAEYGETPKLYHNHFESWNIIQKCFEMQIDMFGLIKDGYALDIEKTPIYQS